MTAWDVWLAVISATLALSTSVVTLAGAASSRRATVARLSALKAVSAERAIGADSIDALGSLLIEGLGPTSLSSYIRNSQVRSEFQKVLDSVVQFLGGSGVAVESAPDHRAYSMQTGDSRRVPADPELAKAVESLNQGEIWNALARSRRRLEVELRERLGGERRGARLGAGGLLRLLVRSGDLDVGTSGALQYAVAVANRGVHGEDVDPGEAMEAIGIIEHFVGRT